MGESNTPKEQVARYYERHHTGMKKYGFVFGDVERRETIVGLVGRGGRVLDVGCRSGVLTQYFTEGNEVVGVEVDRDAIALFREKLGLEGHWLDLDIEPLPFTSASFDVVVCTEVLEHLRFPADVLKEIRRVLKPKGRLIGSVPNATRLRNRWRFLTGELHEDPTHLRQYSPDTLRDALLAEFADVEVLPISGHLLGGGKHGVPVFSWLPIGFRRLMCENLIFVCGGSSR